MVRGEIPRRPSFNRHLSGHSSVHETNGPRHPRARPRPKAAQALVLQRQRDHAEVVDSAGSNPAERTQQGAGGGGHQPATAPGSVDRAAAQANPPEENPRARAHGEGPPAATRTRASVAQLAERPPCKRTAGGSNPPGGPTTIVTFRDAALVRQQGLDPCPRRFDSCSRSHAFEAHQVRAPARYAGGCRFESGRRLSVTGYGDQDAGRLVRPLRGTPPVPQARAPLRARSPPVGEVLMEAPRHATPGGRVRVPSPTPRRHGPTGRGARLRTGRIGVRIPVAAREENPSGRARPARRVRCPAGAAAARTAALPDTRNVRAPVPLPELRCRVRASSGRRAQLLRRMRVRLI